MEDQDVYAAIGEEGFHRLVASFYRRVATDEILGPLYPADDLAGAEQRLRDFLIFRFGGPPHYLQRRGHPRLRMRHAPFPVNQRARDRWIALMSAALVESRIPEEPSKILKEYFEATATFMINRGEPATPKLQ